jgi:putative methionine-R-sulfoxide reductase with GAF domain
MNPGWNHIRSWVVAPLLSKNRLIGILNIDSRSPTLMIATGDGDGLCDLAAIAIEKPGFLGGTLCPRAG